MDVLRVRGARQNNLKGVDVSIALDGLTVVVGRSGSGKSSFAFDTVHAEAQRRYLEALALRVRGGDVGLPRPDVDSVTGLVPTVAVVQNAPRPGGRTTVGTASDVVSVLRVLFARLGVHRDPNTGEAVRSSTHDQIVAKLMALEAGTRLLVEAPVASPSPESLDDVVAAGFSRVRLNGEVTRVDALRPADVREVDELRVVVDRVKVGPERVDRIHDAVRTAARAGQGRVVAVADEVEMRFADRPVAPSTGQRLPDLQPGLFVPGGPHSCEACGGTGVVDDGVCGVCAGTGLGDAARAVTLGVDSWLDVLETPLSDLGARVAAWPRTDVSQPLLDELDRRVAALVRLGLRHLTVGTPVVQLSAGEWQRVRLSRQLASDLSGVLFILDEPTVGLDAAQVGALIDLLRELTRRGNAVLVVEHHEALLEAADHVIEFGPGPGTLGGRVIYEGSATGLRSADTPTGDWLAGRVRFDEEPREPAAFAALPSAVGRNLQGDGSRIAVGGITAFVGPSGAGKSALLEAWSTALRAGLEGGESVAGAEAFTRVLLVDDASARRSKRSMPATYVGFWSVMRELFAATKEARVRGIEPSAFSLNVKGGRCEACHGLGVRTIDLHVLPSVDVTCEVCGGKRFASDVLEVTWKGYSAAQILSMSADEALPILAGHPRLEEALRSLRDVELGYVPLGQPAHTLSGGEARRLRMARELVRAARRGAADTVFLIDEPTVGLHPTDIVALWRLLRRLADEGATVVVCTHDLQAAAQCDHIVRLGPGAGPSGGQVLAEGPPAILSDV